jgi:hypothetical protein
MATTQARVRDKIDHMLIAFGLIIQDRSQIADGKKLDAEIRKNLKGLGHG